MLGNKWGAHLVNTIFGMRTATGSRFVIDLALCIYAFLVARLVSNIYGRAAAKVGLRPLLPSESHRKLSVIVIWAAHIVSSTLTESQDWGRASLCTMKELGHGQLHIRLWHLLSWGLAKGCSLIRGVIFGRKDRGALFLFRDTLQGMVP